MLELLFEGVVSPGYSTEYSYIYLAENPERVPPRREEYEVIDVVEIPLSRALEMLKSGQIRDRGRLSQLNEGITGESKGVELFWSLGVAQKASERRLRVARMWPWWNI